MYTPVNVIQVYAWGEFVGALALDPRLGFYAFEYDPRWLRTGRELAPLQMPGSASPYVFPSLPVETFQRLPALLADALPDRFGNALIDAYLAGKGVDKSRITAIDRLAYMGERSMGALSFKPTRGPRKLKPTAVEVSQLVGAARAALQGQFGDDRQTEAALTQLIHVGTSAGGARAKAVVALHPVTGELRSGQLPADPGFEHWLLKFDGVGMDHELGTGGHYGRIEYAYHLMARSAGIDMPDCRLLEENGRAHFMIKRFDRDAASDKLHMQTLCAMDHLDYNQRGTHDYAQLFQVIDRLRLGPATRAEAFRRMVFNVVAANCDDHTKNHSFLMDRAGQWRLSPAYDVTHAYNPQGAWTHQHLMSVNGRFSGITRQDCLAVADRFLVPDPKAVLRQVAEAVRQWPVFAQQAGLPVEGEPAEFGKNRTLRISRTFRSRGVIGGRQGRGERLLHQGGKRGAVLGAKYPGRLQLQQAPMQHTLPPDAQVRVRFLHREGQDRAQLSQLVRLQSVRGFTWAHKGRVP